MHTYNKFTDGVIQLPTYLFFYFMVYSSGYSLLKGILIFFAIIWISNFLYINFMRGVKRKKWNLSLAKIYIILFQILIYSFIVNLNP